MEAGLHFFPLATTSFLLPPPRAPSCAAGRVALWTKADSVTRFDQFKIVKLP
jgi:hypothetical protein